MSSPNVSFYLSEDLASISLLPLSATVEVATTPVALSATMLSTTGGVLADYADPVVFSSDKLGSFIPGPSAIPVNGAATVTYTPLEPGVHTITASTGGFVSNASVITANQLVRALTLTPQDATGEVGVDQVFTVQLVDGDAVPITDTEVEVHISFGGISGTINPEIPQQTVLGAASSTFQPGERGVAEIQATSPDFAITPVQTNYTVVDPPPTTLNLLPKDLVREVNTPLTFGVQILDDDGDIVVNATNQVTLDVSGVSVTWQAGPTVAAANGVALLSFTPTTDGVATLTATAAGLTQSVTGLTVTAVPVTPPSAPTGFIGNWL